MRVAWFCHEHATVATIAVFIVLGAWPNLVLSWARRMGRNMISALFQAIFRIFTERACHTALGRTSSSKKNTAPHLLFPEGPFLFTKPLDASQQSKQQAAAVGRRSCAAASRCSAGFMLRIDRVDVGLRPRHSPEQLRCEGGGVPQPTEL